MTIAMIAAHDPNLIIGKDGDLPWYYPEDLKHFKNTTLGYPIVMGRITFEELDGPLPKRKNVVLSRSQNIDGIPTFSSLDDALEALRAEGHEKIFIIGGGNVYRQALDSADLLYITQIHKEYEGDTYFPEYRDQIDTVWTEIERDDHEEYSFITFKRKQ